MKKLISFGVWTTLLCCFLQVSAGGGNGSSNMSLQGSIQSNSVCNSGTPNCQCNGNMKSLSVVYTGLSGATVKVYKSSTFNSGNLITTFSNAQNGQTLTVTAANVGGQFQSYTYFVIAGGSSNCNNSDQINTSCSSSIMGKTYGSFKVVGYTDGAGSQCSVNVCDGRIDLTVSGGTAPYTYNWSNGSTAQDVVNLCAGSYSVTVKDKNCTSSTKSFTVGQAPSGISVTAASTPDAVCHATTCGNNHQNSGSCSGTITLTVSGGASPYAYKWSNNKTTKDQTGVCSGSYIVTVTDANGCFALKSVTVSETTANISISATSTPNATCQQNSCNNHQILDECNGSISISVSGGAAPFTFRWSNNKNTEDQTEVCAGNYTVTVTDANGCTATKSVTVGQTIGNLQTSVTTTPAVGCSSQQQLCNGSVSVTATGGTAPYTYQWSNVGGSASTITKQISTGNDDSEEYLGDHSILINGTHIDLGYESNNAQIVGLRFLGTAIPAGATITSARLEFVAYASSSSAASFVIKGEKAGNSAAFTTAANNISARMKTSASVNWNNAPSWTTDNTYSSPEIKSILNEIISTPGWANGNALSILITGSGQRSAYSYENNTSKAAKLIITYSSFGSSSGPSSMNNLCAGTYSVTVTSANGCTTTVQATVAQMPTNIQINNTSTPDASCVPGVNCTGTISLTVSGGALPYSYLWTNGIMTKNQTGVCAGSYTVTVTDANGCSAIKNITVGQTNTTVSCNISGSNSVCPGSSNSYSAASSSSYTWSVTGNASIVGANNQATVSIKAEPSCGQYVIQLDAVQGNCTAVCVYTVNVVDQTPPVISGVGQNQAIACTLQPQFSVPIATDNCGQTPTLTFNDVTISGSCAQSFSIKRIWTAKDACGNTSTASQTISISDLIAPVVTVSQVEEHIQCPAQPEFGELTIIDNCDPSPSVRFEDHTIAGSCANTYTITRTWTVSDACGNSASASQSISVSDTTAPDIIGVGSDETIECPAIPQFSEPIATDFCGNAILTFEDDTIAGLCANEYTIIRSFLAVDDCGNSNSTSQSITVIDLNPPVISGIGEDITVECSDSIKFSEPMATDECGSATLTFEDFTIPGSCANEYMIIRSWLATDACGNNSSASQAISVVDNAVPVISGVGVDVTIQCPEIPQFSEPTATDACGAVTLTSVDETTFGSCPYSFSITRTWTATDACGNTATASQTIRAVDNTAPVMSGIGADETIECPAQPQFSQPVVLEECDMESVLEFSDDTIAGNCPNSYTIIRSFIATDACGNNSSASQAITVVDNTAPVISGVGADETIECPSQPQFSEPTAADACDANPSLRFEEETIQGNCAGSYSVTRLWIATDACGNSSTASQTITVKDMTPPSVSVSEVAETVQCPAQPQFGELTITDACDLNPSFTFEDDTIAGSCLNEYTVVRTWLISDACGNSSSASQAVTVVDNDAPVISGVAHDATIQCPAQPEFSELSATDACGSVIFIFEDELIEGACANEYSVVRIWTATDVCGNSSTASQTITVIDMNAPSISGIGADATISCEEELVFSEPTASDACGNATLTFNDVTIPGNCANEHIVIREWVATDACGNSSSATQAITVIDNTAPVISGVAANQTISCPEIPEFSSPSVSDACGSVTLRFIDDITFGDCGYEFSITRVWTATDACGNTSTASQTITARDTTAPLISGVGEDATIYCPAQPEFSQPVVSDECDFDATISFEDDTIFDNAPESIVFLRTWTAKDACGNFSESVSQSITRINSHEPATGVNPNCHASCDGSVTASGACFSYLWSTGAQTATVENLCAGVYMVTMTDEFGFEIFDTVELTTPSELSLDTIVKHVSCIGAIDGSIDLSVAGGTAPYTYIWSNGFTTQDIAGLSIGFYSVTVTDAHGCKKTIAAEIRQPAPFIIGATMTMVTCSGGNDGGIELSVVGGTVPYTFLWSNGETTQNISGLVAGVYAVTVTDAHGCEATLSEDVTEYFRITASAVITDVACHGEANGAIDLTVEGGKEPYTFNWLNGASSEDLNGLSAGEYSVTITDSLGCFIHHAEFVTEPELCDDNNLCTIDACLNGECSFTAVICDDQDACTIDACENGECVYTAVICDDQDACTNDACVNGECEYTPVNCDDNDACTTDVCSNGVCSNEAIVCADQDECTTDECVNGQCEFTQFMSVTGFTLVNAQTFADVTPLVDGAIISRDDVCQFNIRAEVCGDMVESVRFIVNGSTFRVEEDAPYALAGDNPTGEYHVWFATPGVYTITAIPHDAPFAGGAAGISKTITVTVVNGSSAACVCDDGNACTTNEALNGQCVFTPVICNDNDACTTNACVDGECVYTAIICDDANACTTDACENGNCVYTAIICDDSDACTTDACIDGECVYTAIICDDVNACTTDACENGECIYTAIICDDSDACTTDACVNGECEFTAIVCDDSNSCTTDVCENGNCVYTAITCDDQDACTIDACVNGECEFTAIVCDDSNSCTTDVCENGNCVYTPIICSDDDLCTTDECATGECMFEQIICDDNSPCTTDECSAGQCIHTGVTIEVTHESSNVTGTCTNLQDQLCVLNFSGLPHGTILTGEEYAAYGIHISSVAYPNTWTNTPNIQQLVVFNTFATGTFDHDLQVSIGNIAIFPEYLTDANNNGLVDMPNDTRWGGKQIYTFDFARTILSVTIVDHDKAGGSITAYDEFNNVIAVVAIPTLADGQVAVVPVNAAGVRKLVVDDNDSGGMTDIVFDCQQVCCDGTAGVSATGGSAPYNYSWSNGETIASIDSLCEGTYYVTVTDANGCVAFDTIVINPAAQIGFRQSQNAFDEFTAYPVPFNGTLFFEYNAQEEGGVEFIMYNMLGQRVYHDEFYANKGMNKEVVSMEHAADGMYIIELRKNNYSEFIKVGKNY